MNIPSSGTRAVSDCEVNHFSADMTLHPCKINIPLPPRSIRLYYCAVPALAAQSQPLKIPYPDLVCEYVYATQLSKSTL